MILRVEVRQLTICKLYSSIVVDAPVLVCYHWCETRFQQICSTYHCVSSVLYVSCVLFIYNVLRVFMWWNLWQLTFIFFFVTLWQNQKGCWCVELEQGIRCFCCKSWGSHDKGAIDSIDTYYRGPRFVKSIYTCRLIINNNETIVSVTVHFLFAIFPLPGFHVSEVAHDFVLQLKTWIVSIGMLNSFDSWHGKCLVFLSHEPL